MRDVPPIEKWITIPDAAKELGVIPTRVHQAYKEGRRSRSGERVKLDAWKTIKGFVTTREALDDFHRRLNR